jgi:tetratricopeptide (TPR) repeat protein
MEQTTAAETAIINLELCRLSQGEAQLLAGCLEEAHALAELALALARKHETRGQYAYALRLLGDIAAQRDLPQVKDAETHYRQALALAEELGMRPLVAHCHLGLGALSGKVGRLDQARAGLSTAIELYRSLEMTFWVPRAEAVLAEVEGH